MKGYKKNENIILRKVDPYYFLVDMTENYSNRFLSDTNEIGAFIWENFEKVEDLDALVKLLFNALSSNNQINIEELKSDLMFFITQMVEQNILFKEPKL